MIDRRGLLNTVGAGLLAAGMPSTGTRAASPESDPDRFAAVAGGRIHFQQWGDGETVVLLHKLGGWVQEWRRMAPALAERYQVVAIDLTGHGESDMHGPPPFIASQETLAAHTMSALDTLGVPRPYRFIGSSLGGCVAMVCAALWPDRVSTVVSVGSALGGAATHAELREAEARAVADGQFDAAGNPQPRPLDYAERVFGVTDRSIAEEQNDSRARAGQWIGPAQRGVGRYDYPAVLPRIGVPVLLAAGERGGYRNYIEPAAALLPDATEAIVAGSGAFPHEEAPEATLDLVNEFFESERGCLTGAVDHRAAIAISSIDRQTIAGLRESPLSPELPRPAPQAVDSG